MDISRPDIKKKKLRRQIIVLAIVAVGVTAAAWAVMRLKPAVPTVDASTIWPDTVKRGDMIRNVRGLGTLVPREESIELIPAQTDATVVRIRVLPGTMVKPDTILMDLEDPQLQQQLVTAKLALDGALADYKSLQATLQSTLMDKKSTGAQINAQYSQAELQANTDKQLLALGVISGIQYNQSKNNADQLTSQHQISLEQLDVNQKAIAVQLQSQQTSRISPRPPQPLPEAGIRSSGESRDRRSRRFPAHTPRGWPARHRRNLRRRSHRSQPA
jgi:multidrug efflux pump subunit AcrA (membrane-fusion protein)